MTHVKSKTLESRLQLKDYIIVKHRVHWEVEKGDGGKREKRESPILQNCKTENKNIKKYYGVERLFT